LQKGRDLFASINEAFRIISRSSKIEYFFFNAPGCKKAG
jgi:hypothetical protein